MQNIWVAAKYKLTQIFTIICQARLLKLLQLVLIMADGILWGIFPSKILLEL